MKLVCSWVLFLLLLSAPAGALAQEGEPVSGSVAEILATVRDDLIQLRLEQALATLDTLLERSDVPRQDRAEAWILRARAHVAFGDLDAAMEDYREVLNLRPGFRQESSLVTPEAEKRFNRLRAELISTLRLDIQPADAVLIIDGERIRPSASGTVAVLAGSRRIRLEKRGYDSLDEELDLPAGVEFGFQRQLFPNARDVIVRSWIPGVTVQVDGVESGITRRPEPGTGDFDDSQGGLLVLEDMSLGEHQFEFRMDCHLTQRLKRMVTVDIMEPTPLILPRLEMEQIRVPLRVSANFPAAEIFVDGGKVGDLNSDDMHLCPGDRRVEFRTGGRSVYTQQVTARDGEPVEIDAYPRPAVMLLGAERWPAAMDRAARRFSLVAHATTPANLPAGDPRRWKPEDFPQDVDLVFAVLGEEGLGGGPMVLYSPVLDLLQELTPESVDALWAPRPVWHKRAPGLTLTQSGEGGHLVAMAVRPEGPAARAGVLPGARLKTVEGAGIPTLAAYEAALGAAPDDAPLSLVFDDGGEGLEVVVPAAGSPYLAGSALRGQSLPVMAAWARVDVAAYPEQSVAALANLALALTEAGRFDAAVEMWKRVRWGDRQGIGEGTRAYYLGIVLDRLGREEEAVRAFRRAAGSRDTVFTDDGPPVAPAARDHLVDLGVSPAEFDR